MVLTSCKEDETTAPNNSPTPPSGLTFKVDGTLVTADSANAVLYTLGVPPNNREIDVFVFQGGSQVLEMHFLPKTGPQTAAQNFNEAWLTYETTSSHYHSQSGELNLSTCDTTGNQLEGTFNFVGLESGGSTTKNITEGNLIVTQITHM